jgi:hypothetical protein
VHVIEVTAPVIHPPTPGPQAQVIDARFISTGGRARVRNLISHLHPPLLPIMPSSKHDPANNVDHIFIDSPAAIENDGGNQAIVLPAGA